ncbi:hypothetical protein [uncultured Lutibacter sp.]|uniref:hypothetical protein n=1 Tax=uncultured Lutibacter sp. TaxID=437739 RepID=UPI0026389602|nr:hypothetical protein [uncultured Lutibacter sp.]
MKKQEFECYMEGLVDCGRIESYDLKERVFEGFGDGGSDINEFRVLVIVRGVGIGIGDRIIKGRADVSVDGYEDIVYTDMIRVASKFYGDTSGKSIKK